MRQGQNPASWTDFILLGLTDDHTLQVILFVLLLLVYVFTLVGNAGIMALISLSARLHTPLYFLLANLSFVDICYSSVTTPKMLVNFLSKKKVISYNGCVSQIFFFLIFASVEGLILAIMAYDRYHAICNPLLYQLTMTKKACFSLIIAAYSVGLSNSIANTGCFFRLNFCGNNTISHFYCDIPPLLKLSCNDTTLNDVLLMAFSSAIGVGSLVTIVTSYVYIVSTIIKIHSSEGKQRAFSTCASHFICINLLFGTALFTYLRPKASYSSTQDRVISVAYTVVIPMLNPLIYSLRNQEVKDALKIATTRSLMFLSVS